MNKYLTTAALLWTGFFVGCGSKYPLHPVTGTVTLDGKALQNATVILHPVGTGQPASGITDADGKFKIKDVRADANFGAEVGEYDVTVSWVPPPTVDTTQMDSSSADYDKMALSADSQANQKVPVNKFPSAYGNPKGSLLNISVKAGNANDLNLELSSKGPKKQ